LELDGTGWAQETRIMGYHADRKFDDIFSCFDTLYERDSQTDRQTD